MNKEVKELIEEYEDISKTDRPKIAPYHGDMFIDVEMEYLMRKELQSRIDKAIEYTKILREKYFKECVAGSSYELGKLIEILERGKE